MGKTFKDETFGADGKFRSRQRSHDKRTAFKQERNSSKQSRYLEREEDQDKQSDSLVQDLNEKS